MAADEMQKKHNVSYIMLVSLQHLCLKEGKACINKTCAIYCLMLILG